MRYRHESDTGWRLCMQKTEFKHWAAGLLLFFPGIKVKIQYLHTINNKYNTKTKGKYRKRRNTGKQYKLNTRNGRKKGKTRLFKVEMLLLCYYY